MEHFYKECQICLLDIDGCECKKKHNNTLILCFHCNKEAEEKTKTVNSKTVKEYTCNNCWLTEIIP